MNQDGSGFCGSTVGSIRPGALPAHTHSKGASRASEENHWCQFYRLLPPTHQVSLPHLYLCNTASFGFSCHSQLCSDHSRATSVETIPTTATGESDQGAWVPLFTLMPNAFHTSGHTQHGSDLHFEYFYVKINGQNTLNRDHLDIIKCICEASLQRYLFVTRFDTRCD